MLKQPKSLEGKFPTRRIGKAIEDFGRPLGTIIGKWDVEPRSTGLHAEYRQLKAAFFFDDSSIVISRPNWRNTGSSAGVFFNSVRCISMRTQILRTREFAKSRIASLV